MPRVRWERRACRERGLTLIETVVATGILTTILIGVLVLLESSNRITKQETAVSDAQQSARTAIYELARVVRQARAGGLFYANSVLPVSNNSPGGESFVDLSGGRHYVRKGTDVLGVRGVLLGDRYGLAGGDVTCGALVCDATQPLTITIRSTSNSGVENFPSGGMPAIAMKTRPFYFSVAYGTLQSVRVANIDFLVPLYYVGLVDTAGSWYTRTDDTFTFVMDPRDEGARLLNAVQSTVRELIQTPHSSGPIDQILFFVDEGPENASSSQKDTHPVLVEAIFDPASGQYDVQPLIEEAEDFQVAYGVDGADGSTPDRGVSPAAFNASAAGQDEWIGNYATEVENSLPFSLGEPHFVDAFIDQTVAPGVPNLFSRAVPALRSVFLSVVVKGREPEMKYEGPGARGYQVLDSSALSFSSPSLTGAPYRRRTQSLAVSLRNFQ